MENKKSVLKVIFKVIVTAVCIFVICTAGLYAIIAWSFKGTSYDSFNKKRIAEMENTFKITVTDNITLDCYSGSIGIADELTLEIIAYDYHEFLENNICGTIENYEEYDDGGEMNARFQYGSVKANVQQDIKYDCYYVTLKTK